MTTHLAFDLGAESGRALLGRLDRGTLSLTELRRFANAPVTQNDSLRWDVDRLWMEMRLALREIDQAGAGGTLASIGVDTWGCDYALLDDTGALVDAPFHYRDRRTDGVMATAFSRVPKVAIYETTGIQFLPFNTLYQLMAACQQTPDLVARAVSFVTIPDLLNYWLTGRIACEFTNATTTQCVDARTRTWATDLLDRLDIPVRLFGTIVEPGATLGTVRADIADAAGVPVVAPACHDTGSAVASVHASGDTAFLSSGTWSLLGVEVPAPIVTDLAGRLNFTNEGGVMGTTRLLKNIGGLWLLQACRRSWAARGDARSYDDLVAEATTHRPFECLVDPDDPAFLSPPDMPAAIVEYCRRTGQPAPTTPAAFARAIFESLALKYRVTLEQLEQVTGTAITTIRVIGGGARNRLLNQLTADATGRDVLAGPVEATALGNIAMQMVATGAVPSLDEARGLIDSSFPPERFTPGRQQEWVPAYRRFRDYMELTCA